MKNDRICTNCGAVAMLSKKLSDLYKEYLTLAKMCVDQDQDQLELVMHADRILKWAHIDCGRANQDLDNESYAERL